MNKALFEVGETVRTCFVGSPNLGSVEIIKMEWDEDVIGTYEDGEQRYTGWAYILSDRPDSWADERFLRKLPPPAELSFEELITELNTEKEIA